jgi:hypothetical protein
MMPKLLASYVLFPFVGRNNMPDADARTQTAQYQDVEDDHSAAGELQKVLSLSLPSFGAVKGLERKKLRSQTSRFAAR